MLVSGMLPLVRVLTTKEWEATRVPAMEFLTRTERLRAERFHHESNRVSFIAVHLLVREVVADLLNAAVDSIHISQSCPRCGSDAHGAPHVTAPGYPRVFASWSHGSGRMAVVAGPMAVGIDIEAVSVRGRSSLIYDALSPGEAAQVRAAAHPRMAFLHWWTRKETLVKVGAITLDDFSRTDLIEDPERWGDWRLSSWYDDARDVVAAVAVASPSTGRLAG